MVRSCSAWNCSFKGTPENKAMGITFHRFPKDVIKRKAWALATRREGPTKGTLWKPTNHSCLCSKHFLEKDFEVSQISRRLRDGVIPSVFDFPNSIEEAKTVLSQNEVTEPIQNEVTEPIQNEEIEPNQNEESGPSRNEETKPSQNEETELIQVETEYNHEETELIQTEIEYNQNEGTEPNQNEETEPSQNEETEPIPSFNIQEHSYMINLKRKLKVTESKLGDSKKVNSTQKKEMQEQEKKCQNEETVPFPSFNIQNNPYMIECFEVTYLKRKLEVAESEFENTYKKLCDARKINSSQEEKMQEQKMKMQAQKKKMQAQEKKMQKQEKTIQEQENKIQELLNDIEEQKRLYESVKHMVPDYRARSTDLQIELITRKPGIPYSEEMKTFAKTLRKYSPEAYEFLRETLNLPSSRTLRMKKESLDDNRTEF